MKDHPSISKIRENQHENLIFDSPKATVGDINEVIKTLNPCKATGPDGIPIKFIKTARNVIDSDLTNIINKDLGNYKFSGNVKATFVRPLYKKNDRDKIQSY